MRLPLLSMMVLGTVSRTEYCKPAPFNPVPSNMPFTLPNEKPAVGEPTELVKTPFLVKLTLLAHAVEVQLN